MERCPEFFPKPTQEHPSSGVPCRLFLIETFVRRWVVVAPWPTWPNFAAIKMHSLKRGLPMDWAKQGVKIVHSDQLDLNTPQTSGMTRAAAITHAKTGASKLWAGTMLVQPDAKTGPHHHGELETVLYVVKGRVRMRWGDQLEFSEEARPGDFIYVPPYVPHQEINASPDESCEAVVVRDGQDPIVVNLDLRTPEPASAGHGGMPFHPDR
jgi:uncharacterized RmlC-like cupin family protein